jgi:hypothetical protein
MSLTTRERFYMKIIIAANIATIAASLLLSSGCQIPGGSCDTETDDCLITANDLEGTWCDSRSEQTCLTVSQSRRGTRYTLTIGLCTERGRLSGGLEFNPDTDSRVCLPGFNHNLWSASSASFTSYGLYLYDISQCWHPSYCDGTSETMVWANDLDLSYVR